MRWWVGLVVLVACGGTVVQVPRTRIDNAGAEPRRILRIAPALRSVETFDVTTKRRYTVRSLDTTFTPHQNLADLPSVKLAARAEVVAVERDGTSDLEVRVDDARLLQDLLDVRLRGKLEQQLQKTRSSIIRMRITPSGQQSTQDEMPEALRGLHDVDPRLPSEPVGIGATWSVDDDVTVERVRWRRQTTCHVKDLTDAAVTIDVTIKWRAESQALRVEPHATTRLTSGAGTTTGTMTLRFDRAITASDFHSTLEMNLLIVRRRARVESSVTAESWLTTVPR